MAITVAQKVASETEHRQPNENELFWADGAERFIDQELMKSSADSVSRTDLQKFAPVVGLVNGSS